MSRVFGLLNAAVWALALAIAWTERRDPTRPPVETEADDGAPVSATTDEPAVPATPSPVPAGGDAGGSRAETASAPADPVGLSVAAPPPPSEASSALGASEVAPPPPPVEPTTTRPTAAAPISDEPMPGRPIVGTSAPIVVRGDGPRVPEGAVAGDGTALCPPDHPIKGNANSLIYHQPGQPSYERTIAEFCFSSEEAATAAGYRARRS